MKQATLFDPGPSTPKPPKDKPAPLPRRPVAMAYEPWDDSQPLARGATVHIVNRAGLVKAVRVVEVLGARLVVVWPLSNDILEISKKKGHVVSPRKLAEWHLEPSAAKVLLAQLRDQKRARRAERAAKTGTAA